MNNIEFENKMVDNLNKATSIIAALIASFQSESKDKEKTYNAMMSEIEMIIKEKTIAAEKLNKILEGEKNAN